MSYPALERSLSQPRGKATAPRRHALEACPLSGFRVVIVPGLHGSGPQHWQRLYPAFERVEQEHWDEPRLEVWSARLGQVLRQSSQPTLIVAHSFGCLTTVHRLCVGSANVAGALLVAPADPDKFGVAHLLADAILPCPSLVVGSLNDPWMERSRAAAWAECWGSRFINIGAAGHINAESGLADWPAGLALLHDVAAMAAAFISSTPAPAEHE